jgi:uncharacterized protein (TIGR01777 family)
MNVFLTGGTGLIGRELARRRMARGDQVAVLTRRPDAASAVTELSGVRLVAGDPAVSGAWLAELDRADAVVHLAGQNVFARRWSEAVKRSIRESRVASTALIARHVAESATPPRVLVQGSATGYYGDCGEAWVDESSRPAGQDFLTEVCRAWESAAEPVVARGVRLAVIRTGVVLARGEGALGVMEPLFRLAPGAPVGGGAHPILPSTGRPWMSWIHLDDIVGLFDQALDDPRASGPLNGTAPHPVRNRELTRALSRRLWRPYAFWRISLPLGPPPILLRVALGEVAQVVTISQRIRPAAAERLGYSFRFPTLEEALAHLFPTRA